MSCHVMSLHYIAFHDKNKKQTKMKNDETNEAAISEVVEMSETAAVAKGLQAPPSAADFSREAPT